MSNTIIVTRHKALVEVLKSDFSIEGTVIDHADEASVKGKDVVGILPIYLAAYANTITVLEFDIPVEKRGQELSVEEVRKYMKQPKTYKVTESIVDNMRIVG
jgi:hypothetical protein